MALLTSTQNKDTEACGFCASCSLKDFTSFQVSAAVPGCNIPFSSLWLLCLHCHWLFALQPLAGQGGPPPPLLSASCLQCVRQPLRTVRQPHIFLFHISLKVQYVGQGANMVIDHVSSLGIFSSFGQMCAKWVTSLARIRWPSSSIDSIEI